MRWAELAFRFGPAEYAATLMLLLTLVCVAAPQSLARSGGMAVTGLLLGMHGQDRYGEVRDMTGLQALFDDPSLLVACVAIFAMLLPHIARHYLPRAAPASRGATLWSTLYQCLGFWRHGRMDKPPCLDGTFGCGVVWRAAGMVQVDA